MLTLEDIRKALQGCDLTAVAYHTGLHINTVRKYRDGAVDNPPLDTSMRKRYMTKREKFVAWTLENEPYLIVWTGLAVIALLYVVLT